MSKWIDLTEDLTEEGQKNLKVGQVLIFDNIGNPVHLKIMRKHKGKVWAKSNYLMTIEEAREKDKHKTHKV